MYQRLQLNENVKVLQTNDRRTELFYGILTQEMQLLGLQLKEMQSIALFKELLLTLLSWQ